MIFHIFSALAQFERRLIQERTKAGLVSARARGRLGGRPAIDLDEAKARRRDDCMMITRLSTRSHDSCGTLATICRRRGL
jgi:DNA invertase Pin-like site-specific DNA recombinase